MKFFKSNKFYLALGLIVLIASLAVTFINEYAIVPHSIHSLLLFFIILGFGLGAVALLRGIVNKSPFFIFLSALALIVALTLLLICVSDIVWWLIVLCNIVLAIMLMCVSLFVMGNKTEEIAMNNSPEYETYKERTAKKAIEEENIQAEMPKLRSFSKEMDDE